MIDPTSEVVPPFYANGRVIELPEEKEFYYPRSGACIKSKFFLRWLSEPISEKKEDRKTRYWYAWPCDKDGNLLHRYPYFFSPSEFPTQHNLRWLP